MEVSGGSIHALCDDSLAEILVRLDAVSVLRCRAVCKSWHRIATDHSFLTAHATRRPREMIVETDYGFTRSTMPLSLGLDMLSADDGHRYLFDPCPLAADGTSKGRFEICASLDGLLVLEQYQSPWNIYNPVTYIICNPVTYIICNPVTRQWTNLPASCPTAVTSGSYFRAVACGFYFHASSGEYRLLFHCVRPGEGHYCCILSVGSTSPRRLTHAPPPLDESLPFYELPVSYHGTLHWFSWHPQGRSTGKMLAFDTVSETFWLMSRPPGPEKMALETTAVRDLFELDGELSVASTQEVTLDIWALQDYEAENWVLRHRVQVQPPPRLDYLDPAMMGKASGAGAAAAKVGLLDFNAPRILRLTA